MAADQKKYSPKKVSRFYRRDWQYAARYAQASLLRNASFVVATMPIVVQLSRGAFGVTVPVPGTLWLAWGASIVYIAGWLVFVWSCPKFVRDYHDFGQYKSKGHSHRWILWEFYNNVKSLSGWQKVVAETEGKGLTIDCSDSDAPELCGKLFRSEARAKLNGNVEILDPENVDRDLYIPMVLDGRQILLFLKEDDPNLANKEKEMFWILFTAATKENPVRRVIFWALMNIAGVGALASIVWNAAKVPAALQ